MPPAVALSNYVSSGVLWRIFCQTGIFAGFSLHIINFAVRISEAQLSRAQLSPVEKYTPLAAEFGPEGKHFVSGNSRFFIFVGAAKLRRAGGAQRPVGRGNEPKKTGGRAAHGRARAAKTHQLFIIIPRTRNSRLSVVYKNSLNKGNCMKLPCIL